MLDIEPSVAEHKSSFRDKVNKARDFAKDISKKVRDRVNKYRDDHYNRQLNKANRKSEILDKKRKVESLKRDILDTKKQSKDLKNQFKKDKIIAKNDIIKSKIDNQRVKQQLKREKVNAKLEAGKGKIDTINAKREVSRVKRHNKRAYGDIITKIIAGKPVSPEELASFRGNAMKRGAFEMKSWTDKAPRKALHKLMSGLNSNNPALRAAAVEEFKVKMNAWKGKTALKVEDYRAKRDRRTKLGVEAMKGLGLAMAAKALVPNNDDDSE